MWQFHYTAVGILTPYWVRRIRWTNREINRRSQASWLNTSGKQQSSWGVIINLIQMQTNCFLFIIILMYWKYFLIYVKKTLEFDCDIKDLIYDLTVSISIIIVDGLDYKFPHRTIQDYFMVLFIKDQSDSSKKIIYEQKFKAIFPLPSSSNLFDLCIEMDKIAFYEYYLLPHLNHFIKTFNNVDVANNAIKYIRAVNPELFFTDLGNGTFSIRIGGRRIVTCIDISTYFDIATYNIFNIAYHGKLDDAIVFKNIFENKLGDIHPTNNPNVLICQLSSLPDDILRQLAVDYFDLVEFEKIPITELSINDLDQSNRSFKDKWRYLFWNHFRFEW